MDDLGVIDRYLNVFARYIDSGFGLLGGEVAFLSATLVVIDVTLAGLFWAMGGQDDVIAKLIKKVLYVGAFAFILSNFGTLSEIVFRSFAGLGLTATGSTLSEGELLRPGRLAEVGVDAGWPLLEEMGKRGGFPEIFFNMDTIMVLFIAWLVVLICFFVLAVQMFVTLIEFKLTTLAGFVLVPFALWNKTAFLAEKVLGNVMASGVKVLVLAVIVGVGSGLFHEFQLPPGVPPTIDHALAIMLGALTLFGLGLFGPAIATGLISGGPQLGAGAAAGTVLATAGVGSAAAIGTARVVGSVAGAWQLGQSQPGGIHRVSGAVTGQVHASPAGGGARRAGAPAWAQRMQTPPPQRVGGMRGLTTAAAVVRNSDRGGSAPGPKLGGD